MSNKKLKPGRSGGVSFFRIGRERKTWKRDERGFCWGRRLPLVLNSGGSGWRRSRKNPFLEQRRSWEEAGMDVHSRDIPRRCFIKRSPLAKN